MAEKEDPSYAHQARQAIMGGLGSPSYTLSKQAIVGVVKTTTCEQGIHGIHVESLEMLVKAYREVLWKEDLKTEDVIKLVREGVYCVGEVLLQKMLHNAQAVLFLVSEDSGFITSHNLVLDGGFTYACSNRSFIYK
ncbi:Short-chain dehydrogenase/reductase [Quillaja saponaria]|uniref:Short-chain dehydrogenase/reductase n=1 Tax=Quillaja saponaria TaxID=32244 RepID=A0AAD7LAS9_QUISA|nr:Short-chain dehydrogenase/reductase [Quillaja saponaria]